MALQTANQFQLQPDLAGSLLGGFQAGRQIRGQMDEQGRQAQFRQLSGVLTDPQASPEQKMQAQSQLMSINPERAISVRQKLTESLSQEQLASARDMARGAVEIDAIQTPEGRLQAAKDRKQRLIKEGRNTQETDQLIDALESGDYNLAQQMLNKGKQAGQILGVLEGGGVASAVSEVKSSEILPDGTVQFLRKDGTIEVVPPNEVDAAIIEKARRFGAKIQGLRAGERGEAKSASEIARESFKKLGPIRGNIAKLDRGIELLDEGAETGAVAKFLPSVRAASIKLDQLQGELGLDIVGATTFGALSESELEFAKDVALPKKLDKEELQQWLRDRRAEQVRATELIEEATRFLGTPGNTISDFLAKKETEAAAREAQAPATPSAPATSPDQPQSAQNVGRFQVVAE